MLKYDIMKEIYVDKENEKSEFNFCSVGIYIGHCLSSCLS
jgi:hypothetical protein